MRGLTVEDYKALKKKAFKNVVVHPSVPADKVPAARFEWSEEDQEMVLVGFVNVPEGFGCAEG